MIRDSITCSHACDATCLFGSSGNHTQAIQCIKGLEDDGWKAVASHLDVSKLLFAKCKVGVYGQVACCLCTVVILTATFSVSVVVVLVMLVSVSIVSASISVSMIVLVTVVVAVVLVAVAVAVVVVVVVVVVAYWLVTQAKPHQIIAKEPIARIHTHISIDVIRVFRESNQSTPSPRPNLARLGSQQVL